MESNYKIAQFADLLKVPVSENGEKLIDVRNYNKNIVAKYEKDDMIPYTGKQIFVRDTVAEKLARVSSNLLRQYRFSLKIVWLPAPGSAEKIFSASAS
jgi:hypothetical protein